MSAVLGHLGHLKFLAGGSILRLVVVGMLMALSVATMVTTATGAVFTSNQSVGANAFTTGTVSISTSPTTALVTLSGMAPGDQVTAPVTVSNNGSLQLRYAVTSTTTENTLAGQLAMTVKTGVTTCSNAGFSGSGTVIYGPAALGNSTGLNVIGDPAQGAQAGDRTLNASSNEVLCFNVSLPSSTGNTFQGLNSTATLAFVAEQTASNP